MVNRRLYRVAMQHAELLAEETIDSVHFGNSGVTYYYTLDGKEFTDRAKAIRHQIDYLMEEIKE